MSMPNWIERSGATPRKLALVAVLAVILVGVIVSQLQNSFATSPQANRESISAQVKPRQQRPNTTPEEVKNNDNSATTESTSEKTIRTWPTLTIESILLYDPLVEPDWLAEVRNAVPPVDEATRLAAEAERQQRKAEILRQLREQGAQAVVFSGSEKRAAIGKQSVRIGETIEGLKITDITRQGIVLTEQELE